MPSDPAPQSDETTPWPNQDQPLDGVVSTSEVSQDPNFFGDYTVPTYEKQN